MKKQIATYSLLAVLIILAAFSQALGIKANIGVCACWDAVSLCVYDICGLKVGTFSILANIACIGVQLLILRRDFSPIKLLQVPLALIYGTVINISVYHILTFELPNYGVRVVLWLLSNVGLAVFLGGATLMDRVTTPMEATCYLLSGRTGIAFSRFRVGADAILIAISLLLSWRFGLSLRVREGTVAGMLILGPMMGWCMKREKQLAERFTRRETMKH